MCAHYLFYENVDDNHDEAVTEDAHRLKYSKENKKQKKTQTNNKKQTKNTQTNKQKNPIKTKKKKKKAKALAIEDTCVKTYGKQQ